MDDGFASAIKVMDLVFSHYLLINVGKLPKITMVIRFFLLFGR